MSAQVRQCRKDIREATRSVSVSAVPAALYNEAELGGKRGLFPGIHHPVWRHHPVWGEGCPACRSGVLIFFSPRS